MSEHAILAARSVLEAHIEALNSGDERALLQTLHFPHYRLSEKALKIWETPDAYFDDFKERAGSSWGFTRLGEVIALRASGKKVHFDVEIKRYDREGQPLTLFHSLWVFTEVSGRWAAAFRSSFAES